jgi:tetratricopeptide (TPR) repeat protein
MQTNDDSVLQKFNFTYFDGRMDFVSARHKEISKAISILNERKYVFIESGLGYGLSYFIFAVSLSIGLDDSKLLKIDLSEVISKRQLESKIKVDAGADISQIIYYYTKNFSEKIIFHFNNISTDIDQDALSYLRSIPLHLSAINPNVIFFFSSNSFIRSFREINVRLDNLSFQEVSLILKNRFEDRQFTQEHLQAFYTLSEGIIKKLERIIYYLDDASATDVLEKKDLFKGISYFEVISPKTERQIENLKTSPEYELTYLLIKLLSVLKNGESLKNIRKSTIGSKMDLDHIKQIVDMGIAKTIVIDNETSITKMNPIIKDYILSSMDESEIASISNSYLNITIIETKDGLKINSTNRKVLDKGYSTEGDNGGHLLVTNIHECKKLISVNEDDENKNEMNQRRFIKLSQLSIGYVYALKNSSMYNEVISSAQALLDAFGDKLPSQHYKYYLHISSSFRMLGKYSDAQHYLDKCIELCPENDKNTLALCYVQQLYIYEMTNKDQAIELAKNRKKEFRRNSNAYIVSDQIIFLQKDRIERTSYLERLAKKARKLKFHTTANNILLSINRGKNITDRIENLDEILSYETSPYNQCRAAINKYQIFVDNGQFDKFKDKDIRILRNVYNYLFNQRFDNLFKQCHEIFWKIAEVIRNEEIIIMIYHKGQIIWMLNNDEELAGKYKKLYNSFLI